MYIMEALKSLSSLKGGKLATDEWTNDGQGRRGVIQLGRKKPWPGGRDAFD
jgi:hypothetical protein